MLMMLGEDNGFAQQQAEESVKNNSKIDSSFFYLKRKGFYLPVKIDNDLYEFTREKKIFKVFKNGKVFVDTLKEDKFLVDLESQVSLSKEKIYFIGIDYSGKYNRIGLYEFNVAKKTFEFKLEKQFLGISKDNFYFTDDGITLSYYDSKYFKKTDLVSFNGLLKPKCGIGELYFFGSVNKILVLIGRGTGDAYDNEQYFIVDTQTKKITDVTAKMFSFCTQAKDDLNYYNYRVDQELSSCFPNSLVIYRDGCLEHPNPFVVDLGMNIVSEILDRSKSYYGNFYSKGKKAGAFGRSYIDPSKTIFILNEPNLKLEIGFKKIFDNVLLKKEDVADLNKYRLDLLRNFVYAKHNYKFDDQYYQVYFNQFTFYDEAKKTRKSEVSLLFTDSDKKNIEFISALLNSK